MLDTLTCMPGVPIRDMLPAEEMRVIKTFLNEFVIREWANSYTEVDRRDPSGRWTLWIPRRGGTGGKVQPRSFGYTLTQPVYDEQDPPEIVTPAQVVMSLGWVVHGGYWLGESQTIEHAVAGQDVEIEDDGYSVIALKYEYGVGVTYEVFTDDSEESTEAGARALATEWGADFATRAMLCVKLHEGVLSLIREYNCGQDWCIDPIAALP